MRHALVLADTHIPRRAKALPGPLLEALEKVDLVFHLGDFNEIALADQLASFAPVHAVHGNNDSKEVRERYPARITVSVDGHRFALLHGDTGGPTAIRAAEAVKDADVVLFGHSHRAVCRSLEGRLLFNPGSPTDRRWAPFRSYGILQIAERVQATIVPLP
jgi:putative phosphoesterase